MPLPMVHLAVAHNILNQIHVHKPDMYYLGAISPDAIHMRDGSARKDKNRVHLRSNDNKAWEKRALTLIVDNVDNKDYSFYLGYGVHLLTDMIWFVSIFNNGMKSYADDPSPVQDYATAYYNDTDCIDIKLYNALDYRKYIWELLQTAKPIAFENLLTADEIDSWNKHTLSWYDDNNKEYNPIKYITMNNITKFIEKSSNEIINMLKANIY
jgi:hypothetical protein